MITYAGKKLVPLVLAAVLAAGLTAGCGGGRAKEQTEPISVYLWGVSLYDTYAPYIQSRLPDVDIRFTVGNNDLDFYKFLNENGALPDIITTRRFSLHDAADLRNRLMVLSSTEEAGAVYESYLYNFVNRDGEVNWLPLCGEVDGLVANKALFDRYGIPLPTDYDSFVAACRSFEALGIRGCAADFSYDYSCMELLQGLSIPELSSLEGQIWRRSYDDPRNEAVGLDDQVWPDVFRRMEEFIQYAKVLPEDVNLSHNELEQMFRDGEAAIVRRTGSDVVRYQKEGIDAVMLPYFGENGGEWLLTYPAFHVALNKDLEQDKTRREQAMQVLRVMLSEEGQNTLSGGEDVISYSQNVDLELAPVLENLKPYIQQNHLYIRMASNEFFSVSKDVVSKMILGEYDARQAYQAFDAQLRQEKSVLPEPVLTLDKGCSNTFRSRGGSEAASVMANTLRGFYGIDVLVAPAYSFTGSVLKAEYTEEMAAGMIMPNSLEAYRCEMTGAELKECLKLYVEGAQDGFTPFNRGSLPAVSGVSVEVEEKDGSYILMDVRKDGKEVRDGDFFRVICLNTEGYMEPFFKNEALLFEKEDARVKKAWTEYIRSGGTLAQAENYITLK